MDRSCTPGALWAPRMRSPLGPQDFAQCPSHRRASESMTLANGQCPSSALAGHLLATWACQFAWQGRSPSLSHPDLGQASYMLDTNDLSNRRNAPNVVMHRAWGRLGVHLGPPFSIISRGLSCPTQQKDQPSALLHHSSAAATQLNIWHHASGTIIMVRSSTPIGEFSHPWVGCGRPHRGSRSDSPATTRPYSRRYSNLLPLLPHTGGPPPLTLRVTDPTLNTI